MIPRTREIDGWYPNQQEGSYYILVYEPAPPEILVDEFIKDGFTVETKGDAFDYFCEIAIQNMLEGESYD